MGVSRQRIICNFWLNLSPLSFFKSTLLELTGDEANEGSTLCMFTEIHAAWSYTESVRLYKIDNSNYFYYKYAVLYKLLIPVLRVSAS